MLRLPPLSFHCCAVQRQEGVLKGGVWKKRRKGEGRRERECLGSTATAAAACQDERGREGDRGKNEKAAGSIFVHGFAEERRLIRKPVFLPC